MTCIHYPLAKHHLVVNNKCSQRHWKGPEPVRPTLALWVKLLFQCHQGVLFSQHIRKITGECLKQYFLRIPKAMCWYDENWSVQVNFEWVPGPLRPPLAVWGSIKMSTSRGLMEIINMEKSSQGCFKAIQIGFCDSYHNNIIDIQNRLPYSKVVYPAIIVLFHV